MGVQREAVIDDETADEMLAMYLRAFEPLKTRSATKQTLDDTDFRALLAHDDVIKIVCRDRSGTLTGFTMMTPELKLVPWISQEFYAHRYPEHDATNRLFYVPCLLVDPSQQHVPTWLAAMSKELALISADVDGIVLMDCCAYNDDELGLPAVLERICHKYTHHETELIDSQRYFALHHRGRRTRAERAA